MYASHSAYYLKLLTTSTKNKYLSFTKHEQSQINTHHKERLFILPESMVFTNHYFDLREIVFATTEFLHLS